MNNQAFVTWNASEYRYDLHIDGKLKAYSDGHASTRESHEEGKKALIQLAKDHGYEVKVNE